jgi:hypothetical protein
MDLTFAVLALLPLALASLVRRERGTYAGFGFLAALAPVIAKGVGSLINHGKAKSEAKKQAAYETQQAAAKDAADRAAFESAQDAPAAAMQRLSFNTKLAKILGQFGGREKTPGFLLNAFDTARKRKEYVPGAAAVPKPQAGGGFWNFASGLTDALGYLDTSKIGKGGKPPLLSPNIRPSTGGPTTPTFAPMAQAPGAAAPLVSQTKRLLFK